MAANLAADQDFALSLQLSLLEEGPATVTRPQTPGSLVVREDWELARELFEQELKAYQQIEADRRLAASIRRAVVQDAPMIDLEAEETRQFQNDLALARRLENSTVDIPETLGLPVRRQPIIPVGVPADPEPHASPKRPKLGHFTSSLGTAMGTSSGVGHKAALDNRVFCDVCTDRKEDYEIVSLSCEHHYCRPCLYNTFKVAIDNPKSSFPPRCCEKIISTTLAAEVLSDAELERYLHESVLHDAGGIERLCYRTGCNQVLFPGWIKDDVGLCLKCNQRTCMICRGAAHAGDCPRDEDTINLLKLAGERRWQSCPQCGAIVDLSQGCFHMTCRCKFQFCYQCAAKWKTCTCPTADVGYITGQPQPTNPNAASAARSFSRIISATRRAQMELEHRTQAVQYDEGLKRRLEELKTLRRTRESQRDAVMVDRMVMEEEDRVREELREEARKMEQEKRKTQLREIQVESILRKKLVETSEAMAGKGKGKGKSLATEQGSHGFEALLGKLVQTAMVVESMPDAPKSPSPGRSKTKQTRQSGKGQKRELSPTTDRIGSLYELLKNVESRLMALSPGDFKRSGFTANKEDE